MADEQLRRVKLSELKPGPIRRESLSVDQLEAVRAVYEVIGRLVRPTFEQFELSFCRDADPDQEIAIWLRIAQVWQEFFARHPEQLEQSGRDRQIVLSLVVLSIGGVPEIDHETLDELQQLSAP